MSKYQEALDNIKIQIVKKFYPQFIVSEKIEYLFQKEVSQLQELVDKATPKKVINIYELLLDVYKFGSCPSCENEVNTCIAAHNCGNCSQALDWSNT